MQHPIGRVKVAIPIRVRGMSTRHKFFEEPTETVRVSRSFLVTRIQNLVDLETELYVVNPKTNVGGTFRVVWVNNQAKEGWHDVGLELIDAEGDLWGIRFPKEEANVEVTQAWLECQRCHQDFVIPIPEAEDEFISDGFVIARPCDHCKATTPWAFTPAEEEVEPAPKSSAAGREPLEAEPPSAKKPRGDMRSKGRAPLELQIKVIREKYGTILEDICRTVNVSRHGVCFLSSRHYEVGEQVMVVLPYKEADVAIPVPARVLRQEQAKESYYHAVAIKLEDVKK